MTWQLVAEGSPRSSSDLEAALGQAEDQLNEGDYGALDLDLGFDLPRLVQDGLVEALKVSPFEQWHPLQQEGGHLIIFFKKNNPALIVVAAVIAGIIAIAAMKKFGVWKVITEAVADLVHDVGGAGATLAGELLKKVLEPIDKFIWVALIGIFLLAGLIAWFYLKE